MGKKQLGDAQLGDLVKDSVTGFQGIVVCRSQWLNGCWRITVQPREIKDGKQVESACFDDLQLEVVERGAVPSSNNQPAAAQPLKRTGGPRPDVQRQPDATR